jgi:hypothetical protein
MKQTFAIGIGSTYQRYKITESGVSPRAIPGVPGHTHTAASDEHDEDGVLISDESIGTQRRPYTFSSCFVMRENMSTGED